MERVVKFLKEADTCYLATFSSFTHDAEVVKF